MKPHEVREIVQCLPKGKTPFHYYKDRYALWLLSQYVGTGKKVRDVKSSRFGRLLQKPILCDTLRRCASGIISTDDVCSASNPRHEAYHLELGEWGGRASKRNTRYQTSRPGKNIVLRLNFTSKHDEQHDRILPRTRTYHPLEYSEHPIAKRKYRTLAWARCDVDLANGEGLIEEIQNDWLRYANWEKEYYEGMSGDRRTRYIRNFYRDGVRKIDLHRYFDETLQPHHAIWDEAMLTATLSFLHEELGIHRIYYNTWDTGCRFKGINRNDGPPRSLYTKLPRRFCFEEMDEPPTFLKRYWARRLRTHPDRHTFRWFHLEL